MIKLLATIALLGTAVHAETLEEKKYWKGQTDYMTRSLEDAEKRCGVKFTFEWVDRLKLRDEAEKSNYSPNGICDNIVQEVVRLCRAGEDEKATVKAKIKGFTCGWANPRTLDLKAGIVKYLGNNTQNNFSDWAKPWLMKHL